MNSTDIVGYVYSAAMHCPDCTHAAMLANTFKREPSLKVETDQHGVALDLIDSRGNPVTVVFCGEDALDQVCDDCGVYLLD